MIEITSVTFEAEIVSSNNERETDGRCNAYVENNEVVRTFCSVKLSDSGFDVKIVKSSFFKEN